MKSRMPWGGIAMLVAGIVIAIAGMNLWSEKREDMSSYPAAEAVVLEKRVRVTGTRFSTYVEVRYEVEGTEYISNYTGPAKELEPGMKITVHYDPRQPERITPKPQPLYLLFAMAGAAISIIGIVRILLQTVYSRR